MSEEEEEGEGEGFWLRLMSECSGRTELPQGRRLLVLGDDDAEKTLLVDRLDDAPGAPASRRSGNGLQYRHLSVRDEYRENQARLGVWLLDGDPFYRPLLKYALDADSLSETVALVVASMSRPWDILDAVRSWTGILREHVEGLDMFPGELERRKAAVLERYREYVEPGLSIYGSLAADNTREIEENLGLELVVVVTRTEQMRELQAEWGYEEEHFDFIQLRLRDFCLRHGAALFYVSVREDKNCDPLRKYLLHRSYPATLPFRLPGILVERDAILVPAGWDNRNKVRFLSDTLPTIPPSTPYRDVVFRPARMLDDKRVAPEVYAQGDQEFLAEVQSALERPTAELPDVSTRGECSTSTTTVVQRNVARRMARGAPRSPQKKRAEGADNTLSNFFHSLLNRRTSTPSDRPVGMSGARTYDSPHPAPSPGLAETDEQATHQGGESGQSKFANSVHLSLDQGGENRQLPEYFLSNPVCSPDCSFQTDSSSFDLEEQFSPPLDRVRSSFNPPLRTLLERPDSLLANGETTRSKERADKERTNGEIRCGKHRTDEETRSKERTDEERTNGEIRCGKHRKDEETRSKERTDEERTNGEIRSSKHRKDEETRSKERTDKERTNGEIRCGKHRKDEETRSKERTDEERTNGEIRSSKHRKDEETRSKERTDEKTKSKERMVSKNRNEVTRSSKDQTYEETGSKEQTNGDTGSGKERTDEECEPRDVSQNGETDGQHRLTNGETESRKSGSADNTGEPPAGRDKPETVMTPMPLRVGESDPPDVSSA